MDNLHILGIDLGRRTFHCIGHDQHGHEVFRKKFNRAQLLLWLSNLPHTTVAFESCGGAHWLARKCESYGHEAKLIPPQYVKPYVKSNKNDFIDAAAIAEAASRPSMRFAAVKSENAQVISTINRAREAYIKERTATMLRIGGILVEFGLSLPKGHSTMKKLFQWIAEQNQSLPQALVLELKELHEHYLYLTEHVQKQEQKLIKMTSDNEIGELLMTIPGVAHITASSCLAEIASPGNFKCGRDMAAWIGLVPRQYSTGGKTTLLGISKRGNKRLRTLFIHCARAVLSKPETTGKCFGPRLTNLRASKPFNVVVVALANKLVRIAWAVMNSHRAFNANNLACQ
ncbi:IS110 family transposase [Photobacterium arenosum]|uniref:IS110 family transposase n=1 Tax=Photobacterium arenosum TaxID=2774143 RepID=UPI00288AB010|nr:IS110 family transposase [Photobacterium arenosum]